MGELFSALGIQWSVLLAQMVNFAILLFILKKFVYKPLLKVIDQRRETIAESMKTAEDIRQEHSIIEKKRLDILRKADEEAGKLMERAKGEIEISRSDIEKAARAQAAQIIAKGMEQLENERAAMITEMQNKLAHAIVLSAEKILRREFSKEDQQNFETELKQNLPSMLS